MWKFIIKRLILLIPILLGITFIIFSIMSFTPGDPARLILGENAPIEEVEKLREEMGLNQPFITRYLSYLLGVMKGDFGKSYRTGAPVFEEIFSRISTTLKLSFFGITLATLIGVPIGIISAVKQYTIIDTISLFIALILTSIAPFWFGLLLILTFSLKLNLLPSMGADTWSHFVLPTFSMAIGTMAIFIRMTRSTMLEVIRQDYIRTARAKGASEGRVILKHALGNALLPIITVIGLYFGLLLGGAVIIETVYAMPGLGSLMIVSVRMMDIPVIMASLLLVTLAIGLINLIVDLLYAYVDPRIRSLYIK